MWAQGDDWQTQTVKEAGPSYCQVYQKAMTDVPFLAIPNLSTFTFPGFLMGGPYTLVPCLANLLTPGADPS